MLTKVINCGQFWLIMVYSIYHNNYDNMLEEQLEKLGLHKNESKIYLALFELGKTKAGKLIDHTKLHRNLVYTALEELTERGLVTKIVRGAVAEFSANDPEHLIDELEDKKTLARKVAAEIKMKISEAPREVTIHEGNQSIVDVALRNLNAPAGETYYVLGASEKTNEPFGNWDRVHKKRIKNGIQFRGLYDHTVTKNVLAQRNSLPMAEARYFPFDIEMPVWFNICKDKLAIMVTGEDPLVFDIRSRPVADAMKKYFEYFWNQQVSVETGIVALERTIYNMLDELKPGEEYCVLGAASGDPSKDVRILYDKFHTDRIKKGVVTKMLVYRESLKRIKERFEVCGDPGGKVSYLKTYASAPRIPMQINTFKNKAFIILYGDKPTVINFERHEIYEGFKAYFDSLWNQDTYVVRGPQELYNIWMEGIDTGGISFIGARAYFMDRYPQLYKKIEEKMRGIKNVYWKMILDPSMSSHRLTKYPWSKKKYILSNTKNINVVWLYNNKVAVVNWAEDEPIVLISENKILVQSYNDYFEELWNKKQ
jgi:sugar-specific transcriptional regulator TrmB